MKRGGLCVGVLIGVFSIFFSIYATPIKDGISPQIIKLPKGPGSIEGMGDSFNPNPSTGTFTYSVPVRVPDGAGGLTPSLAVTYSTSYGMCTQIAPGWSLNIPYIKWSIRAGIPDEVMQSNFSGPFQLIGLGGSRELIKDSDNTFYPEKQDPGNPMQLVYDKASDTWTLKYNRLIYYFGAGNDSVLEGKYGTYSWYLNKIVDRFGNTIIYRYEKHGRRPYISNIEYNFYDQNLINRVTFNYTETDIDIVSSTSGIITECKARLREIVVQQGDRILYRYAFGYKEGLYRELSNIKITASDGTDLPELSFDYYSNLPQKESYSVHFMENAPSSYLSNQDNTLMDIDGDGLSDFLKTEAGNWRYRINLGDDTFDQERVFELSPSFSLSNSYASFCDIDGDSIADLITIFSDHIKYMRGNYGASFDRSVEISPGLSIDINDPDVRFSDQNGDGLTDILISSDDGIFFVKNLGNGRFSEPVMAGPVSQDQTVMFSQRNIRLADVNGDGLSDILSFQRGYFDIWLSTGMGHFEYYKRVSGLDQNLDPQDWIVGDINKDGISDLLHYEYTTAVVYLLSPDGMRPLEYWISNLPQREEDTYIGLADMDGNRTKDIVVQDGQKFAYIELFGNGDETYALLLRSINNGRGLIRTVEYSTTAILSKEAKRVGSPWDFNTPVNKWVVTSITETDSMSLFIQKDFDYRDGIYDGTTRRFYGFRFVKKRIDGDSNDAGLVEIINFYQPPEYDRVLSGMVEKDLFTDEDQNAIVQKVYEADVVKNDLGSFGVVKGVRQTLFREDASSVTSKTTITYDEFANKTRIEEEGFVEESGDERITEFDYYNSRQSWLFGIVIEKRVYDGDYVPYSVERFYYDGQPFVGLNLGEVEDGLLMRKTVFIDPSDKNSETLQRAYKYDQYGNKTGIKTKTDLTITIDYDSTKTYPTREVWHLKEGTTYSITAEYDRGLGRITEFVAEDGGVYRYEYDGLGRLKKEFFPDDGSDEPTYQYEYILKSPVSILISHINPEYGKRSKAITRYDLFDGYGRKIQSLINTETDGISGQQRLLVSNTTFYGIYGKKKFVYQPFYTDTLDQDSILSLDQPIIKDDIPKTEFFYDSIARLMQQIEPDGGIRIWEFDGERSLIYDPDDTERSNDHYNTPKVVIKDGLGRISSITYDSGKNKYVFEYSYDPMDRPVKVKLPDNLFVKYLYDGLGRLLVVDSPDTGKIVNTYSIYSVPIERSWFDGSVVRFSYDSLERVTSVDLGADGDIEYRYIYDSYDGCGAALKDGNTTAKLACVIEETELENRCVLFGYDLRKRRNRILHHIKDSGDYLIKTDFDRHGRLKDVVYPDDTTITYRYSKNSSLIAIDGVVAYSINRLGFVEDALYDDGQIEEKRGYDIKGRLISLNVGSNGNKYGITYSYDIVDNLIKRITDEGTQETFHYDALNRLIGWQRENQNIKWEFEDLFRLKRIDANGEKSLAYSGNIEYVENTHRISSIGSSNLKWDSAGRLNKAGEKIYRWNMLGRLIDVKDNEGNRVLMSYGFDGQRRRKITNGKTIIYLNRYASLINGRLTKYIYAGKRLVAKIESNKICTDRNNCIKASGITFDNDLFWLIFSIILGGLLILFMLILREQGTVFALKYFTSLIMLLSLMTCKDGCSNDGDERISYYHLDYLNSPVFVSHDDGNIEKREYGPYGDFLGEDGEFGFVGNRYDKNSGLLYATNRYLIVGLGLWLSPEPLLETNPSLCLKNPLSCDPYTYSYHNPTRYKDDNGRYVQIVVFGIANGTIEAYQAYIDNPNASFGRLSLHFVKGFVVGATFAGEEKLVTSVVGLAIDYAGEVGIKKYFGEKVHYVKMFFKKTSQFVFSKILSSSVVKFTKGKIFSLFRKNPLKQKEISDRLIRANFEPSKLESFYGKVSRGVHKVLNDRTINAHISKFNKENIQTETNIVSTSFNALISAHDNQD